MYLTYDRGRKDLPLSYIFKAILRKPLRGMSVTKTLAEI